MKTLYLIRHAKSSWANSVISDCNRPLNDRGKRDAPEMGNRLFKRGEIADLIVSSSAKRARKTAIKIAKAIKYPKSDIALKENLYHANYREIINTINQLDNSFQSAYFIGHNPGMSIAASELTGTNINMVTTSVVKIEFETDEWSEVFDGTGDLIYHDYPKALS